MLTGRRLGVYEVQSLLGAGGMGEVYRARDTKLGRDVAIKILPAAFTSDPDRLARFEREARLLASLNHPHIGAIYGFEESDGVCALVLELIEGETLAERIEGPRVMGSALSMAEALGIARQIVEALDAAHEKGIVHRDLKPANIKITPDSVVKVLDFGLAKGATGDEAGPDLTHSPTVTIGGTREGVILGTAAYMSPEQARGQAVDKRTDIWAFGCVLYEMLTGHVAFAGATVSDTIAAILERQPEWARLPASTPAYVQRLLRRCLQKEAKLRLRDIGDARADLNDVAPAQPDGHATPTRWRAWRIAQWLLLAGVAGGLVLRYARPAVPAGPPADDVIERLTFDSGFTGEPSLSPDGKLLAYTSDRSGRGNLDIWMQQTNGGVPLRLTDDLADDVQPDFSPDGSQIVFRSDRNGGGIYVVPALGGAARLVAPEGRNPRFSPDGSMVAYWTGQFRGNPAMLSSALYVVALAGGTPTRLVPQFVTARDPIWAPDGKSLLALGRRDLTSPIAEAFDWWRMSIDGGAPSRTHLMDRGNLRDGVLTSLAVQQKTVSLHEWTKSGVLLSERGSLWTIPLSESNAGPVGEPRRLVFGAGLYSNPTISRDGEIVFSAPSNERVIERLSLTDSRPTAASLYSDGNPAAWRTSVTRDGSMIVFERLASSRREIWQKNLRTGEQRLVLPTNTTGQLNPTVSPDGSRIGYVLPERDAQAQTPQGQGYLAEVAGGVPRRLCDQCVIYGFLSDSRRVVITKGDRAVQIVDDSGVAEDVIASVSDRIDRPSPSPNDRWMAFRRIQGTNAKVFVAPILPGGATPAEKWSQIDEPTITGRPCGWSPDSSVLYLLLDTDGFRDLWGQRIDGPSGRPVGKPYVVLHLHKTANVVSTSLGNAITADGFLYETTRLTGNLWRLSSRTVDEASRK